MTIKTGVDKVLKEISLFKQLKHENVLTLHEIINDEPNDKLYLSNTVDCQDKIKDFKNVEIVNII